MNRHQFTVTDNLAITVWDGESPHVHSPGLSDKQILPFTYSPRPNLNFFQLFGNIPNPRTLAFLAWKEAMFGQRDVNVPNSYHTKYYFSNGGNDSNPGTITQPLATWARFATLLTQSGANAEFLFQRGGLWREYTAALSQGANVYLHDYGDSTQLEPHLTAFIYQYASGSWNAVQGNLYTTAESHLIGWCRYATNPQQQILQMANTSGSCANLPYSFNLTSGNLFLNLSGANPNGVLGGFESCPSGGIAGIEFQGNLSRFENFIVEGYALDWVSNQSQVRFTCAGPNYEMTAHNIQCYFGADNHPIGHYGGALTSGGFCTLFDCKVGYAAIGFGEVVGHSSYGGHETLVKRLQVVGGTLPKEGAVDVSSAMYAHTAGVPYAVGLVIQDTCTILGNRQFPCTSHSFFVNLAPASSLEGLRAFVINESNSGTVGFGQFYLGNDNTAYINCNYSGMCYNQGSILGVFNTSNGWVWNTLWNVDCNNQGTSTPYLIQTNATGIFSKWYCNHLQFMNVSGKTGGALGQPLGFSPTNTCSGFVFNQNIVSCLGAAYQMGVNQLNDPQHQIQNGYYGITEKSGVAGYDKTTSVTLSALPVLGATPITTSQLYNVPNIFGLEYDYWGNPRTAHSIGPINGDAG